MQLFYKQYSTVGEPLIILHGLFGQQGNWAAHAKALADKFSVYSVDARNHGQSGHTEEMSYPLMAEDLKETMDALGIDRANFIGHSMGGKIVMQFALNWPERVRKLVVVDIAPVSYAAGPDEVLTALLELDLNTISSRKQADEILEQSLSNKGIRDFLLTNLQRDTSGKHGAYKWRMNLEAIAESYANIKIGLETDSVFPGETLFVKGGESDYLLPIYTDSTLALFPEAKVSVITGAGHWVHSEKPEQFLNLITRFLQSSE